LTLSQLINSVVDLTLKNNVTAKFTLSDLVSDYSYNDDLINIILSFSLFSSILQSTSLSPETSATSQLNITSSVHLSSSSSQRSHQEAEQSQSHQMLTFRTEMSQDFFIHLENEISPLECSLH